MTLRVGSDFSGIDTPLLALRKLGVSVRHVFASDSSPTCRKVIKSVHGPTRLYSDVQHPKHPHDVVDVYCLGPPCQPYSRAGRNRGDADPRALVDHSLEYISRFSPKAVMLEEVADLANAKHKATLTRILRSLRQSGYKTKWKILNSSDHGVAQNRPRIYVVAVRKDQVVQGRPFKWPAALSTRRLPLDRRKPDDDARRLPPKDLQRGLPRFHVKKSIRKFMAKGVDPRKTTVFTDVFATGTFHASMNGVMPCLTRERAKKGGFWVSTRGRLTTTDEMFRFQGLDPAAIKFESLGISVTEIRGMLGNAMTVNVCGRVLRELIVCAGLVHHPPADPWAEDV